ncbi:hypothetical protein [Xanthomonas sp. 1678]|uniref:hypothetical protein n=1 Tax=Xanthomonas sp. 1678 TaxID=3158788 RepID=UPI0028569BDD|nr:hypothetical protein [Xanthomonas translucens]
MEIAGSARTGACALRATRHGRDGLRWLAGQIPSSLAAQGGARSLRMRMERTAAHGVAVRAGTIKGKRSRDAMRRRMVGATRATPVLRSAAWIACGCATQPRGAAGALAMLRRRSIAQIKKGAASRLRPACRAGRERVGRRDP